MKKTLKLLISLIIIIVFATGCKVTPKKEIVVNKINNEAQNTKKSQEIVAKETINKSDKNEFNSSFELKNNIVVDIKANLKKPKGKQMPVAYIITRDFSKEETDKMIELLFNGRELYKPWKKSKDEIENEIIKLKQIINDSTSTQDEKGIANARLESKETEYENAPEVVEKQKANTDFSQKKSSDYVSVVDGKEYVDNSDIYTFDSIEIWAEKGESSRSVIEIVNLEKGANSWIIYVDDVEFNFDGHIPFEIALTYSNDKMKISWEDAKKIATEFISKAGLNLELSDSTLIAYIKSMGNPNEITKQEIYNSDTKAYKFYFTRSVNDVNVTYDTVIKFGDINNDYNKSTYYELVSVVVDENGIKEVQYRAPYFVTKTVESDGEIINENEAIEIFSNNIKNTYEALENHNISGITIHSIVLGLSRIKSNDGRFVLVPTYDFLGSINYIEGNETADESINPAYSICTVNALDGSIIDKAMGY